ncbi:hypothetical protein [Marinitoga sp. 1138]|uniref:hypothetical protein n=1 Tax=Marinitoga sp. 1138 TaxID=1643334 RepID=UPI00158618BE|nr:hypothetical protein [Marinitoga sp. 1138]NUU96746.1 hypothetical protein [Marinitoga sp. 1138]
MKNFIIEGTIKALTPIFHGGDEKTGSTPVLRTIMMYVEGLGEVAIPYYSGNAFRGKGRRLLIKDFIDHLDYEIKNSKLYHVLYSGGLLETSDKETGIINLEMRKKIRTLLPPIALLGTSIGNQIIPGILIVEHMFPICMEYKEYLPEKYKNMKQTEISVRTFTDQSFFTRRDDLREERNKEQQAIQMKVDYECFIPGTTFYHRLVLQIPTELQISTLGRMIKLMIELPYLGGKSASGDGKVKFEYENVPKDKLYLDFIEENKEKIITFLKELEEVL